MKQTISQIPILGPIARRMWRKVHAVQGDRRLRRQSQTDSVKIVVGSSGVKQDGWTETDIEYLNLLNADHWSRYFKKNTIDAILAEHVWEHLSEQEGKVAAMNCYDYLKPGGYLRVAVPDGFHPDDEYIRYVEPGGMGSGADDHKVLYNHETMSELFGTVGFDVRLLEYFDSGGEFHFSEWDAGDGMIKRSIRFDQRNKDGTPAYTSLIMDCRKVS